ncbi:MAG TPA: serine--tRNA ligase [Candidatus Paceibacterota bacterium]
MLDIKFIRDNAALIKAAAKKKHLDFDLDKLLAADNQRLELLKLVETARARQNAVSEKIAGSADKTNLIAEMTALKTELKKHEEELSAKMKDWQRLMLEVPNVPDMSVPDGVNDSANQEIKTWGQKPQFAFSAKSHLELLASLAGADFERGARVAGFRGYLLIGVMTQLSLALWHWALDRLIAGGFTPMFMPALVKRENLLGTGYLPQGAVDLYVTQDGDYLSGTAEVPVMGSFLDEILPPAALPKKIVAFSPCFRREAGSHGKDVKGLMRVHEFFKVEQVILCAAQHEESVRRHEELLTNAEGLMQALKLPYRVVINCGGDLGLAAVKKYDLEAWVPSENKYRETHSISYFHDFQTRRLNIRTRSADSRLHFVHSLNGTALATPRLLIPLLENYQQADGSILVPEVLRPYLGGRERLSHDRPL